MVEINNAAEAIAFFHLNFHGDSISGPRDYTPEELNELSRIEGLSDPQSNCENLASMIKALWVARQSGELPDEDLDNSLWGLYEFTHLVSLSILVASQAEYLMNEARAGRIRKDEAATEEA